MTNPKLLETEKIGKLLFTLSVPAILSLVTNSINIAIDRIFVGRAVGSMGLSAISIAFGIYLLIQAFSQLVASGASSLIAIKLGQQDKYGAKSVLANSFLLSIITSIIVTSVGLLLFRPILTLFGANQGIMSLCEKYTKVMFCGAIFFVLAQTMNNSIRGMGNAKQAMINFLSSIVINIILNYFFLFVLRLGIAGSSFSTLLANAFCALFAILYLSSKSTPVKLDLHMIKATSKENSRIIAIGISGFILQAAMSFVTLVCNRCVGTYGGNSSIAVYGVISTILTLVYMPITGVSQGMQPIIGYNYGAKLYERVKKAYWYAIIASSVFAVLAFIIFQIFNKQVIFLFNSTDASFMALGTRSLKLTTLMLFLVGFQIISSMYFQFIGEVRKSIVLSALRQLFLLIPLVVILPFYFKLDGVWYAFPISDLVASIITGVFVFVSFHKKRFSSTI